MHFEDFRKAIFSPGSYLIGRINGVMYPVAEKQSPGTQTPYWMANNAVGTSMKTSINF